MQIPLLYDLQGAYGVIVGAGEEAQTWAKALDDFGVKVQVVTDSDEERESWRSAGLDMDFDIADNEVNWLTDENFNVEIVVAAKENSDENDEILLHVDELSGQVPLKASVTPSIYITVSLPSILKYPDLTVSITALSQERTLNDALAQELDLIIRENRYQNKYLAIASLIEAAKGDEERFERVDDSLYSMFENDEEEIREMAKLFSETMEKELVFGVVDDPYMVALAKEYIQKLQEAYPDWSITLKELSLPYTIIYRYNSKLENFQRLQIKSMRYYQTVSRALLNREIDLGLTDLIYPLKEGENSFEDLFSEGRDGILRSPVGNNGGGHMILNKAGVTDIKDLPETAFFIYDELDLLPQIQASYSQLSDKEHTFTSEKLRKPLETYLKDFPDDGSFLSCSQTNLDLLGITDENLKELGFSIIRDRFATPVGFKEFSILSRCFDPRMDEMLKTLSTDKETGDLNKNFMELRAEINCNSMWLRDNGQARSEMFLISFEYEPSDKTETMTLFVSDGNKSSGLTQNLNVSEEGLSKLSLKEAIEDLERLQRQKR